MADHADDGEARRGDELPQVEARVGDRHPDLDGRVASPKCLKEFTELHSLLC